MNRQKTDWISTDWIYVGILWVFFVLLTLFSQHFPFFWDNVLLSSRFALSYYNSNFSQLLLPETIDCGHPPFFGMYLASTWKIFGQNLIVSHWAMLPFLLILGFHFFKIVKYYIQPQFYWIPVLLLMCEPSIIAQCTMVSNDVVLISCFIWGWSAILYNKKLAFVLATLLMTAVSIRGAILVFLLFLIGLVFCFFDRKQNSKNNLDETNERINKQSAEKSLFSSFVTNTVKILLLCIPAFLLFVIWNGYHYQQTGWMLAGGNPKWGEHYEAAGLKEIIKNCAIIVRNMLDFGRLFLWLGIGFVLYRLYKIRNRKKECFKNSKELCNKKLIALSVTFILTLFVFAMVVVFNTNPIGHRYQLPFYAMAILLFAVLVQIYCTSYDKLDVSIPFLKSPRLLTVLVCIGLLTGNLWIYPEKMAQGWDSTLAHVPYFELREKMLNYIETQIDENKINENNIGGGFTMHLSTYPIDLKERNIVIGNKSDGLANFQYIWYSNTVNNFSDEEIDELYNFWILEQSFSKRGVFVKLFKRPSEYKSSL